MMLNNRITDLIFCNFYDLLFFRYGAFYVIIVYVNIVFTSDSNVISVITVVILIIFVIKVYNIIDTNFVLNIYPILI